MISKAISEVQPYKMKKFFQQAKLDVKFKMAGEGHRLDEEKKKPTQPKPGKPTHVCTHHVHVDVCRLDLIICVAEECTCSLSCQLDSVHVDLHVHACHRVYMHV